MSLTVSDTAQGAPSAPSAPSAPPPSVAAGGAKPHLVIEPVSGWAALSPREIWRFKDLLFSLAGRDLKLRYKQTVLGVVWVVLQPLMAAAIFAFVFGTVARFKPPGGVPYFLFAFAGMACWTVFSSTMSRTSNSMVGNAHLVSKVYFPRLVLPLASVISTLIDFAVAMCVLLVLVAVRWQMPGWNVLLAPVCVLLILMLALGLGLCATALAVSYRDVQFIVPFVLQLLLYGSPIGYDVTKVPAAIREYYYFNPLASILEAFRWSVLSSGEVHWGYLAYAAAFAVGALALGAWLFNRMERKFADVV